MSGVQPRRSMQARVASSAKRGANVPTGVPGVYRLRRARPAAVQSDDGRAGAETYPWVQPADVTLEAPWSQWAVSNADSADSAYWLLVANSATSEPHQSAAIGAEPPGWTNTTWSLHHIVLDSNNLSANPVSPTPPPGFTVEYEAAQGVLVSARLRGTLLQYQTGTATPSSSAVWEIQKERIVPGQTYGFGDPGPTHIPLGGGTQVYSRTVQDPPPGSPGDGGGAFQTPLQLFDADQRMGWTVGTIEAFMETPMPDFGHSFCWLFGPLIDPSVPDPDHEANPYVEWTYTPPRYRFVPA